MRGFPFCKKGRIGIFAFLFTVGIAIADPYEDGRRYFETANYEKALPLLTSSAKKNKKEAQYLLGLMYLDGLGILPDDKAAFGLIRNI